MKRRVIIVLFIMGILLIITGAVFKVMHWGFGEGSIVNGNTILATGLGLKVVALILFMSNFLKLSKK